MKLIILAGRNEEYEFPIIDLNIYIIYINEQNKFFIPSFNFVLNLSCCWLFSKFLNKNMNSAALWCSKQSIIIIIIIILF